MKYEVDSIDESVVTLDTYNSDLNLVIDASKYKAQALTKEGFAFMWAGARATHGIEKGKVCFEVKIVEHLDVSHLPSDEPNPHVVRIGFSVDSATLQLGEEPQSYGYGGTGKISVNCQFKDFGPTFKVEDCILAVADMDSDPVQIGFGKNGKFVGWAFKIKKIELEGKALFPHVLTKNCAFEVNFGQKEKSFFPLPNVVKGYTFIGCLSVEHRIAGARPPEKREDCEMIMMCGLPGAGKSVWAAEYSKKNPQKKYNILGTNNIIDKMKVMGLPRKRNYHGRWDVLIQMATKCLNTMFSIGSKLRRNYILDQTNVYPTAQRRKMRNFDGFKRIAVVVVPADEEYKKRCDKRDREEGKEIPDSAVLEMKANFKIPQVSDIFNEVIFTELQKEDADKLVKKYNEEGKSAAEPSRKQFRGNEIIREYNSNKESDITHDSFASSNENTSGFKKFQWRSKNNERVSFTDRSMHGRRDFSDRRGGFAGRRGGFAERNRQPDISRNFGDYGCFDDYRREFGSYRPDSNSKDFDNIRSGNEEYRMRDYNWSHYSEQSNYDRFTGRESYDSMVMDFESGRGRGRGTFDFHKTSSEIDNYNMRQNYPDYRRSDQFGQDQKMYRYDNPQGSYESNSLKKYNENSFDYNHMSGNYNVRGSSVGDYTGFSRGSSRGDYTDISRGSSRGSYTGSSRGSSRGGYTGFSRGSSQGDYTGSSRGNGFSRGSSRGDYTGSSRGNYSVAGSKSYPEQKSAIGSYGEKPPEDYSSKGLSQSSNRYQHDNRNSSSRNIQGFSNNSFISLEDQASKNNAQVTYSKDYGYSSSGYEKSDKYQSNSDSLQQSETVSVNTSNKLISGSTGTSVPQAMWSSEISQMPAAVSNSSYVTYKPTNEMYAGGVQTPYSQNSRNNQLTPSYQKQTHGYQQGMSSNITSQPWAGVTTATDQNNQITGYQPGMSSNVTSQPWAGVTTTTVISNPSNYALTSQIPWPQYGQQAAALNHYYTK